MNTLLLRPTDILFFKDGRPMSGSLPGHGAAWPLPTVTNAALHAALHRAAIKEVHTHRRGRSGDYQETRDRKFGSLLTAGPFPVSPEGTWFFPRPLDSAAPGSTLPTFKPVAGFDRSLSNLSAPIEFPVANSGNASKDPIKPWWDASAWKHYLSDENHTAPDAFLTDSEFFNSESTIGIGLDPETDSQNGKSFFSAHYLRLLPDWKLGLMAAAIDKVNGDPAQTRDLLHNLFPNSGTETPVIVGGQQRICSVLRTSPDKLPLPIAYPEWIPAANGSYLLKWILLTPAVFPNISGHPGGSLPSWCDKNGKVQLLDGPGKNYARRHPGVTQGKPISAKLVAAMVGKPVPVSGYALDNGLEDRSSGPKATHLAVPPGSVYYFRCDSREDATALANSLNWHGNSPGTEIRNRRSTLFGEKGFGLGVCASWSFQ